jgi:hypothetical protein
VLRAGFVASRLPNWNIASASAPGGGLLPGWIANTAAFICTRESPGSSVTAFAPMRGAAAMTLPPGPRV